MKDNKPQTMRIDDVDYVRADSVHDSKPDVSTEGLPYVVVRSRDQGVMVGYLREKTDHVLTLIRARQVWYWKSRFILAEFAEFGPTDTGKISCELSQAFEIAGWCGLYRCTKAAGEKIRGLKPYEP